MAYLPSSSLGADEVTGTPIDPEILDRLVEIDDRTAAILASQKKAETRWKWQAVAGVAGALFAAVKLGIIVIPSFRRRRQLGAMVPNPRRRSR